MSDNHTQNLKQLRRHLEQSHREFLIALHSTCQSAETEATITRTGTKYVAILRQYRSAAVNGLCGNVHPIIAKRRPKRAALTTGHLDAA